MPSPLVSLLIATRNEAEHLSRTIECILKSSEHDTSFEVIICDASSTDETISIINSWINKGVQIRVIENKRLLAACGWNLGIEYAQAPIVLILSGHAFLPQGYLQFIVNKLSTDLSGVGALAVPVGQDTKSKLISAAFSSRLGNGGASFMNPGTERCVESISFGAYWKRDLLEIGGFDENIARGQDWDLNLRLRKANKTLWFDPSMRIEYSTRSNFKSLWRRQYLAGLWKYIIHKKNESKFLLRHLIPAMFAAYIPLVFGLSFIHPTFATLLIGTFITHLCLSYFEFSKKSLPIKQFPLFWWALLIIQIAYGAGFIVGLIRPPRS